VRIYCKNRTSFFKKKKRKEKGRERERERDLGLLRAASLRNCFGYWRCGKN